MDKYVTTRELSRRGFAVETQLKRFLRKSGATSQAKRKAAIALAATINLKAGGAPAGAKAS